MTEVLIARDTNQLVPIFTYQIIKEPWTIRWPYAPRGVTRNELNHEQFTERWPRKLENSLELFKAWVFHSFSESRVRMLISMIHNMLGFARSQTRAIFYISTKLWKKISEGGCKKIKLFSSKTKIFSKKSTTEPYLLHRLRYKMLMLFWIWPGHPKLFSLPALTFNSKREHTGNARIYTLQEIKGEQSRPSTWKCKNIFFTQASKSAFFLQEVSKQFT